MFDIIGAIIIIFAVLALGVGAAESAGGCMGDSSMVPGIIIIGVVVVAGIIVFESLASHVCILP